MGFFGMITLVDHTVLFLSLSIFEDQIYIRQKQYWYDIINRTDIRESKAMDEKGEKRNKKIVKTGDRKKDKTRKHKEG